MKVIGITGGIGSGKSKVLDYMEETYHARVLKTDLAAHKLQEPGNVCYLEIIEAFGNQILTEEGKIDRKELGNLVFSDRMELERLNRIVHPAVKRYVKEEIAKAETERIPLFLLESALLMEDHYEEICDELWYVFAEKTVRIERLKESRNLSFEKIEQIMSSQADEESYRRYCDVVIDNSGTFENTKIQIAAMLEGTDGRE